MSKLQSCVGNLHCKLKIIFQFYESTFDSPQNNRMLRKQKNNEKKQDVELKMQFSCYFRGHKNLPVICLHFAICSMNTLDTINQQTLLTVGILFLPISLSTSSAKILILYGKGISTGHLNSPLITMFGHLWNFIAVCTMCFCCYRFQRYSNSITWTPTVRSIPWYGSIYRMTYLSLMSHNYDTIHANTSTLVWKELYNC